MNLDALLPLLTEQVCFFFFLEPLNTMQELNQDMIPKIIDIMANPVRVHTREPANSSMAFWTPDPSSKRLEGFTSAVDN